MKIYNKPIMKVTTFSSISSTNAITVEVSAPIENKYAGTDKIDKDTFNIQDLNQ